MRVRCYVVSGGEDCDTRLRTMPSTVKCEQQMAGIKKKNNNSQTEFPQKELFLAT